MDLELFAAFVAASVALMLMPGPNVALIVANSIAYGRKYGLFTVAGTSLGMIPQLLLAVVGMSAALTMLASIVEWIRWLGVAYLLYLAVQAFRMPAVDLTDVAADARSARTVVLRGVLVSLTNPKTLLFYAAFFPQFITPDRPIGVQLAILAASFLGVAVALDSCWAVAAGRLRRALAMRASLRNSLTGGFYMAAATGLALARV